MASVYDFDAFAERVSYAAAGLMAGRTHTRHFDTCFEMYDGLFVVEELIRRTEQNPRLAHAIKYMCGIAWDAIHERLKSIPPGSLATGAAHERNVARNNSPDCGPSTSG